MQRMNISGKQLFALMFLFEIGSSIVVSLGTEAKQDAWLAVLLGMLGGLPLFAVYAYLYYVHNMALTSYLRKLLGTWLGGTISVIYILYFFYISARVLRDFGELLTTSSLNNTPLIVVMVVMMVTVLFSVCNGFEVFARAGSLLFIASLLIGGMTLVAMLLSGIIHVERLLPMLENGITPVIKAAFPLIYTFPFGEMIVFTMLMQHTNNRKSAIRAGFAAIIVSGIVLSVTIILNICILGVTYTEIVQFPLLLSVSRVRIGEIIQRLDAVALSALIVGGFVKISIFFYAGALGIKDVFKLKTKYCHIITIIIAAILIIYIPHMASNFSEHILVGLEVVPYYLHLPLQTGVPLLLLLITLIKRRR
ncbi:GerAB/ArcD/ProY family transporter [Ectobacillus antri]|uniref:GerAB/ArcD/ProY family transporter n=1 Tax=Ectobacillus antri TaxID=2486280 RepID=A0ABT6H821_9BACI|nr:GerAB/ArcD/ProY family transporter [Ectobacillus antri]MDG4658116.1 GerAB/ArcD/ProY family transporter [Ectobacillus antri]MDG5754938.1 GerAB/ArcD/ProY family transporter [Ectobacillus antri]